MPERGWALALRDMLDALEREQEGVLAEAAG